MIGKIAFFPGVYDTVYKGQLDYARFAKKQFGFDKIIFVNYNNYPHQKHVPSVKARFNTVNMAIHPYKYMDSLGIEFNTKKKVHLYHVIKYLRKTYGLDKVNLLLGADRLREPTKFYKWNQVLDMINLHVIPMNRESNSVKIIDGHHDQTVLERFKSYLSSFNLVPRYKQVVHHVNGWEYDHIKQSSNLVKKMQIKYADKDIPSVKQLYERKSSIIV